MRKLARLGVLASAGIMAVTLPNTASADSDRAPKASGNPGTAATCPTTVQADIRGGEGSWKLTCTSYGVKANGSIRDNVKDSKDICLTRGKGGPIVAMTEGWQDRQTFELRGKGKKMDLYLKHC